PLKYRWGSAHAEPVEAWGGVLQRLLAACRTWQPRATQRGAGHGNDADRRSPLERREIHAALPPAAVAHPAGAVVIDDHLGGVGVDHRALTAEVEPQGIVAAQHTRPPVAAQVVQAGLAMR